MSSSGESTEGEVPGPRGNPLFATTEWSVVCAAQGDDTPDARQALATLCHAYWYPLYAYVRRRGHSPEDAQDLTQEFFARLLERDWLEKADPAKGRFRSFLLTVLKRFLMNEWDKAHAQKRGGDVCIESLSTETAETRFGTRAAVNTDPELQFDREWAITLLDSVLDTLAREYREAGKSKLFDVLKPQLAATGDVADSAKAAAGLGMSEGALRVALCRLRQRYRERLRQEVSRTVARPEDVDSEMRHLARVLAKG